MEKLTSYFKDIEKEIIRLNYEREILKNIKMKLVKEIEDLEKQYCEICDEKEDCPFLSRCLKCPKAKSYEQALDDILEIL